MDVAIRMRVRVPRDRESIAGAVEDEGIPPKG
jgi:hypothetical protein